MRSHLTFCGIRIMGGDCLEDSPVALRRASVCALRGERGAALLEQPSDHGLVQRCENRVV
jgi:hypothetical protein